MTKTEEPLAAILAEMRYRADNHRQDGWESVGEELDDLADRIDAAAERERNAHTNDIHNALYMAAGTPGNAAAMREALERIVNLAPEYPADGVDWNALAANAFLTASAALAAPSRNCDRFNNATEAGLAYRNFLLARSGPVVDIDENTFFANLVNWLFARAEGGAE